MGRSTLLLMAEAPAGASVRFAPARGGSQPVMTPHPPPPNPLPICRVEAGRPDPDRGRGLRRDLGALRSPARGARVQRARARADRARRAAAALGRDVRAL